MSSFLGSCWMRTAAILPMFVLGLCTRLLSGSASLWPSSYTFITKTTAHASFITRRVAFTDDRDTNGFLPTATTRFAAFLRARARAHFTLRHIHFPRTRWALNGLNRCVFTHTQERWPVSCRCTGTVSCCRVMCQGPTTVLLFVNQFNKSKRLSLPKGTHGPLYWCMYLWQDAPTYCLINDRAEGSPRLSKQQDERSPPSALHDV